MKQIKLTKELAKTLIEKHDPIIIENYSFYTINGEFLIRKFDYNKVADEYLQDEKNILHYLIEEIGLNNKCIYDNLCKIIFEKNTLDRKQELINEIKDNIKIFSIEHLANEDIDTIECYSYGYLDDISTPIYIIEP